jgi:hypothetical protein
MLFLEAVGEFARDYKKQIENQWSEELDAVAIGIAEELFTSGKAPAAPANEPMAADPAAAAAEKVHEPMVEAPGGEQMPLAAARRVAFKILAQAKANMSPKVNQSQGDQVPGVGKKPLGPGKDSEQGTSFSDPAVKKKHTPKQKSPTGLGKATDGKDPGRFKAAPPNQHSNVPKKVTKDTNLGKDSDTFGKGIPVPKVTKNH